MSTLLVTDVHKSYGKRKVLDGISFDCCLGKIVGVFGRNGSGKSTLFKLVAGTLKADSIQINIDQQLLKPAEIVPSQKIGFLPQESFLPKEMKVRDIIPFMFPKGEEQDSIFYSAGVATFDNTKIGKLSAGQRKYLELLLVAHLKHPFLLLDEPFSLVEPFYIEKIKELLFSLKAKKGVVLTDHYYTDVLEVANHGFVLNNGKAYVVNNEQDLTVHEYIKVIK